jgi:hypothetical protein
MFHGEWHVYENYKDLLQALDFLVPCLRRDQKIPCNSAKNCSPTSLWYDTDRIEYESYGIFQTAASAVHILKLGINGETHRYYFDMTRIV